MDKNSIDNIKKHIDNAELSLYSALKVSLYEMLDDNEDNVIEIPTSYSAQAVVSLTSVARTLDYIRCEIMLMEEDK